MWHIFNSCNWFNAKFKGRRKRSADKMAMESYKSASKTIFDINEYNVLHVCSYIRMSDRMGLILAAEHFSYICPNFNLAVLSLNFKVERSKIILSRAGPYIRKLQYATNVPVDRIFYVLMFHAVKHCPNVEELDFSLMDCPRCSPSVASNKYLYYLSDLMNSFSYIQILRLRACTLSDMNSQAIANLSILKFLDISFNGQITGKYLCKLKNLKYLNLTQCIKLRSDHFIEICESNKLITLSIIGCYALNSAAIEALEETQPDMEMILVGKNERASLISICRLKKLKYLQNIGPECFNLLNEAIRLKRDFVESVDIMVCEEDNHILGEIALLKNLKRLNLYEMQAYNEFLIRLIDNCSQLEELTIPYSYINRRILVDFVRNLEHLKILNIIKCKQMSVTVFRKIVTIMKKRKLKPIRINVTGTRITKDFLETEEYLRAKDFVTLSFNDVTSDMFYHNEHLGDLGCKFSEDIILMQNYGHYKRRNPLCLPKRRL